MLSPNQIQQANRELAEKIHSNNNMQLLAQYCLDYQASIKEAMGEPDVSLMQVYKLQQEFIAGIFKFANVEQTLSN